MPDPKTENTDDVKALIGSVNQRLEKLATDLKSGLDGQRSMYDSRFARVQQDLHKLAGGNGDSYDRPYNRNANDRSADNQESEADRLLGETDRFEQARDRFERRHPLYTSNGEVKKRVDAIMADNSRRADILSRDDFGRINYDRAYRTAYLEARDQISIEAEAAAATARAQAETENRNARATAALSGDVAEELPEGLSLDDIMDDQFTPEMMVEKGLVAGGKKRIPIVGV